LIKISEKDITFTNYELRVVNYELLISHECTNYELATNARIGEKGQIDHYQKTQNEEYKSPDGEKKSFLYMIGTWNIGQFSFYQVIINE
jgi:hypothetical protein